jgi:hypothetical protein
MQKAPSKALFESSFGYSDPPPLLTGAQSLKICSETNTFFRLRWKPTSRDSRCVSIFALRMQNVPSPLPSEIPTERISGTGVPSQDMGFFLTLYAVNSILPPVHMPCLEASALRIDPS